MLRREYTIECDDDNGCWMLLEDGVGLARSKSRKVLVRLRDALWAVEGQGLAGLTVENDVEHCRGVVQGIDGPLLTVRKSNNKLATWVAGSCSVVEPERPDKPTPWNDPAIGVLPAVELLKRVLACGYSGEELRTVGEDIQRFLKARADAQPTP